MQFPHKYVFVHGVFALLCVFVFSHSSLSASDLSFHLNNLERRSLILQRVLEKLERRSDFLQQMEFEQDINALKRQIEDGRRQFRLFAASARRVMREKQLSFQNREKLALLLTNLKEFLSGFPKSQNRRIRELFSQLKTETLELLDDSELVGSEEVSLKKEL